LIEASLEGANGFESVAMDVVDAVVVVVYRAAHVWQAGVLAKIARTQRVAIKAMTNGRFTDMNRVFIRAEIFYDFRDNYMIRNRIRCSQVEVIYDWDIIFILL